MVKTVIKAIEKESVIKDEDFFFSMTNPRGIITAGSAMFFEVSKYSASELIGKPQNIFRHPDMPQIIFKLLWDTIQNGKPFVAFIKSLAKDGTYFWVLATVFPMAGGYLAIRVKPKNAYFEIIPEFYTSLVEKEKSSGLDASLQLMKEILKTHGFDSYTSFASTILGEELDVRVQNHELLENSSDLFSYSSHDEADETKEYLMNIHKELRFEQGRFVDLFQETGALRFLHGALNGKVSAISGFLAKIDTLAINTAIATARVGKELATLETIAAGIQRQSEEVRAVISKFKENATILDEALQSIRFGLATSYLQDEMIIFYVNRLLIKKTEPIVGSGDTCRMLATALQRSINSLRSDLQKIKGPLYSLRQNVNLLEKLTSSLEMIQKTGTVESARSQFESEAFLGVFLEMRTLIEQAKAQISGFSHSLWEATVQGDYLDQEIESTEKVVSRIESGNFIH